MKAKKGDTLIIAVGEKDIVEKTMRMIVERINFLLDAVPEETRRVLDNGDTEYMRPLPGSARMYPETDIPPVRITKDMIDRLKKDLPELIEDKMKRFVKEYGLNDELARQLVKSEYADMFEELYGTGAEPKTIASTLLITLKELKRDGVRVKKIEQRHLEDIFKSLSSGKITKTAIPSILKEFAKKPGMSIDEAITNANIEQLSLDDVDAMIDKIINEDRELALNERGEKIIMGMIMQKVRGRVDGKLVMERLKMRLKEFRKNAKK